MIRYFRLYLCFLRFSVTKALEFRVDFLFRVVMDTIYYIANIAFFKIIYLHTPTIGGMNEKEAMVLVGTYLFIDGIYMTFLSSNFWHLPLLINKGDLDYYLTRPVSSRFFLTFKEISLNSAINALTALGILTWAISNLDYHVETYRVFVFALFLMPQAFIIHINLTTLFIIPVFWTQSDKGLIHAYWQLQQIMERPHTIYSSSVKMIFTKLLPLLLITSVPVFYLLGKETDGLAASSPFVMIGSCLVTHFAWKKALKSYTSASS